MSDDWSIRVGDADRDQIAEVLGRHAADGRLTLDELDQRLESLYAAVTRGDARKILAGLPPLTAPGGHHHWHLGHEGDGAPPALPEWFASRSTDPQARPAPALKLANAGRARRLASSRSRATPSEQARSVPGGPGSTREYVKAELERARRFNTPVGIAVSQKLQEAYAAGRIRIDGDDESELRREFDDLRAEIRREATEQLSHPRP